MIGGVVHSFASVTVIRVLSRVLEFFLRLYLIREVLSEEVLAQMVALDLILTSSLHVVKACFRPSYQQVQSKDMMHNIISAMNLMTVGLGVTLISTIIVCVTQYNREMSLPYLKQSIVVYGFAAMLEALKEKYSVSLVLNYEYRKIALIELLSYLPKTLILFLASKFGLFQQYGILMFAVGQIIFYGLSFLLTFIQAPHKTFLLQMLPASTNYLDPKTKKVVKQLSYISILKLFLQEFQKIVLVINNVIKVSSVYSLVSNLGSIVVRFLFAPLEEIAYNYYTRGTETESVKTFLSLTRGLGFFFILCIGFGFRYSQNVLMILFGERWISDESIMAFKAYLLLLSVMGFNGTIQAFVLARADPVHTIPKLKYFTILSTSCYFASSLFFMHLGWGASGLFLGNTMGMCIRIVISWNLQAKKHIGLLSFLKGITPNLSTTLTLLLCISGSYYIKSYFSLTPLQDFVIGVCLFGVTCIPILLEYREPIMSAIRKSRKSE